MSIREGIEQNRAVVVVVCLVLLATAIGITIYMIPSASSTQRAAPLAYFYDQNTKQLFTAPDQLGPIETTSGPYQGEPAGVRAHVFACGRCSEESNRFIGWLSKRATSADDSKLGSQELIRRPGDSVWVLSDSPRGEEIVREVNQRCKKASPLHYCHPEK